MKKYTHAFYESQKYLFVTAQLIERVTQFSSHHLIQTAHSTWMEILFRFFRFSHSCFFLSFSHNSKERKIADRMINFIEYNGEVVLFLYYISSLSHSVCIRFAFHTNHLVH